MRRFFVTIVALASAFCFAEAPSWLKKPEKDYPTSQFVRAIGEGASQKQAQNDALSSISRYFDTKTEVITGSIKEMNATIEGDETRFSSAQAFRQVSSISSSAEFFCVNFTEGFYNEKTGKYSILAYINKNEAAKIYRDRISNLLDAISSYQNYAKTENETFLAAMALHKALKLSDVTQKYIAAEGKLVPADSGKYLNEEKKLHLLESEYSSLKKQMTFSITMTNSDSRYDGVFTSMSQILSERGYSYSLKNSAYKIVLDISAGEESTQAGEFVRPSVNVLVVNNAGNGVCTYSKSFSKIGGKSLEQAHSRAAAKISADLKENFLAE